MAHGNVPSPGSIEVRYEGLSGGPQNRLELYIARRYFNMGPQEWEETPWWLQRVYMEGLKQEGILLTDGKSPQGPPSSAPQQGQQYSPWELDPLGASDAEFRAM